jgi:hypothetical protein
MTMTIKLQRTALLCMSKVLKILHPGGIRSHDLLFRWRRRRTHKNVLNEAEIQPNRQTTPKAGLNQIRVARWYIYLHTKNPNFCSVLKAMEWKFSVYFLVILVIFLRPFSLVHGHLVYLCLFGIWFPILLCRTKKNLAATVQQIKIT